jgi:hypothetical protein
MRTRLMTATLTALTMAGALTLQAQTPQNPPTPQAAQPPAADAQRPAPPPAPAPAQRAGNADQPITITGCLKEEKDVPGLKPNPAERAGLTEDYILTDVKTATGSAVSGIGVASMYELEGIAEAELKKHLNHQVEVVGKVKAPLVGVTNDTTPNFEASSIKMLAATCPAAP